MNKIVFPALLVATIMVAGAFAFVPVEQASTVHLSGTTLATNLGSATTGLTVSAAGVLSDIDGEIAIADNTTITGTLDVSGVIGDDSDGTVNITETNIVLTGITGVTGATTVTGTLDVSGVIGDDSDGTVNITETNIVLTGITGVTGVFTTSANVGFNGQAAAAQPSYTVETGCADRNTAGTAFANNQDVIECIIADLIIIGLFS